MIYARLVWWFCMAAVLAGAMLWDGLQAAAGRADWRDALVIVVLVSCLWAVCTRIHQILAFDLLDT